MARHRPEPELFDPLEKPAARTGEAFSARRSDPEPGRMIRKATLEWKRDDKNRQSPAHRREVGSDTPPSRVAGADRLRFASRCRPHGLLADLRRITRGSRAGDPRKAQRCGRAPVAASGGEMVRTPSRAPPSSHPFGSRFRPETARATALRRARPGNPGWVRRWRRRLTEHALRCRRPRTVDFSRAMVTHRFNVP